MNSGALFHGDIVNTSRIICTPSEFAKTNLLYIQEIGSLQAAKPHRSIRNNLSSYLFFIVKSGSGTLFYNDMEYSLNAGDCVFIDCKAGYSHQTSDNLWSLSWVHFYGSNLSNIYSRYIECGGTPVFRSNDVSVYIDILTNLYDIASNTSQVSDLYISAELGKLLALLMKDIDYSNDHLSHQKKACVSDIKAFLDEHFHEKITLDLLAERFYINKYYLTRVFKEEYGISIMDYLLNVRITEAKKQLRFTDMPAEEIGIGCGIGDIYYFSRIFKKIEGIGIRDYRRNWK